MTFVARHYNVIPTDQLAGDYPDRALCITFDDGYRSVRDNAVPVLRNLGLPATVYLISEVVTRRAVVWVNEINWYLNVHREASLALARSRFGQTAPERPAHLLDWLRSSQKPGAIQQYLCDLRTLGPVDDTDGLYLLREDIVAMREADISFGNHTATHPSMPRLSPDEQAHEIRSALADLIEIIGQSPAGFAFPFGDTTAYARDVAYGSGHAVIMDVGGVNEPFDPRSVARTAVKQSHPALLFAELEILPAIKGILIRCMRIAPGRGRQRTIRFV